MPRFPRPPPPEQDLRRRCASVTDLRRRSSGVKKPRPQQRLTPMKLRRVTLMVRFQPQPPPPFLQVNVLSLRELPPLLLAIHSLSGFGNRFMNFSSFNNWFANKGCERSEPLWVLLEDYSSTDVGLIA